MFRKMLVCTDLSPASEALIQCVEELKSVGMEEVVLTHVIYVANTPGLEEMLANEAGPLLERQKKILEDQGIRVTVEMPFGLPARTIGEIAKKHDVSAILIGSHGRGILQTATLGSVSAKLLHETRRPVLLARIAILEGERCHLACGKLFSNILFPTDFSETAEHALNYLGKIAAETECPVTILHVLDGRPADAATAKLREEDCRSLLEAKKHRLHSLGGAEAGVGLANGEPGQEIVDRADKGNFSLIVMGSQGKGFVKEVFLGSVANKVARHAGVPVLFIPTGA